MGRFMVYPQRSEMQRAQTADTLAPPLTVRPSTMTFLALDIGNTRLKWALYAAPHPGAVLLEQGAVFLKRNCAFLPLRERRSLPGRERARRKLRQNCLVFWSA